MTDLLDTDLRNIDGPEIAGWPAVPPRLVARLDESVAASRLTVIGAPAGTGKTALVSCWLAGSGAEPIAWIDVASVGGPAGVPDALRRSPAADVPLGGGTRVVVLDGLPAGPPAELDDMLRALLAETAADVRLILLGNRPPSFDLHGLGLAGRTLPITAAELALAEDEIADLLARSGVDAEPGTVGRVAEVSAGWAGGVRLAARQLQCAGSAQAALAETERTIADQLDAAVLRRLTAEALRLLTATSMVAAVTPELADAVLGDGHPGDPGPHEPSLTGGTAAATMASIEDTQGFVERSADGSLRCHPLLRRLLARRLAADPEQARQAARRAARFCAARDDHDAALEILVQARDWAGAGHQLIETLAVPRLIATGHHPLLDRPDVADGIGAAEPLVLAAVALGRSWPETALRAIEIAEREPHRSHATVAERLSLALLKTVAARSRASVGSGIRHARQVLELLPALTVSQRDRAPELVPLVQSHLGAFALWGGAPERSAAAFQRGARGFGSRSAAVTGPAWPIAAADCLGQLAFVEAIAGELTTATRHASDVLTARPADGVERGVVHAQLATVWTHAARGELAQAVQRFESVSVRMSGLADGELHPGRAAALGLVGARLAAVTGDSRLSADLGRLFRSAAGAGFFGDQLRLARAEAELDAGQPTRAIQLLADAPRVSAEIRALRCRAWLLLGDLSAAGTALRVRPGEPAALLTQLQLELLEARLAHATGDWDLRTALVERALRTAAREQLRTPLRWAKDWLHTVVASDRVLMNRYGSFVTSIGTGSVGGTDDAEPATRQAGSVTAPATPLTRREADILARLGTMSTNEEIAAQLYLSTNTIKTHLKSLYRKLDVARRSDAVRRGRALGLC